MNYKDCDHIFQKMQLFPAPSVNLLCISIMFLLTYKHYGFARGLTKLIQLNLSSTSHLIYENAYIYDGESSSIGFILPSNMFLHYPHLTVSLKNCHNVMCISSFISYWTKYQFSTRNGNVIFQHIRITNIKIHEIDEMAFVGIHCLRTIRLEETSLTSMPPLAPLKSTFEGLFLSANDISFVPKNHFLCLDNLHTLKMWNNDLCFILDITPLSHTMIYVNLSASKIRSISGSLIKTIYPHMKNIYFGYNNVHEFDWEVMTFWPALQYMNLKYNNIVSLPTSYSMPIDRNCSGNNPTVILDFTYNPIHCGEAVKYIISRRASYAAEMNSCVRIIYLKHMVCA